MFVSFIDGKVKGGLLHGDVLNVELLLNTIKMHFDTVQTHGISAKM